MGSLLQTLQDFFQITVAGFLSDLKARVWYKYNVIKVKTLPPTWTDRDEVILHACFQILVDFVQKEWGGQKPEVDEEFIEFNDLYDVTKDNEIWSLYQWWTQERPKRAEYEKEYWKKRDNGEETDINDYVATTDAWWAEDDRNLLRLIKVRIHLWT